MEKVRKDALEANFLEVYDKFKFSFYRKVFSQVKEREGSLTAMEVFSLEVINQLGRPTIGKFAEFLNISQSNATYKVASLINKGYLRKERSGPDKREYYLVLSEKYYGYIGHDARLRLDCHGAHAGAIPGAGAGSGRGDAGHHVP